MTRVHWIFLVAILATSVSLGCRESDESAIEPSIRSVRTVTIGEAVPSSEHRRFPGIVQAAESSTLSFQVSGKVVTVDANAGDAVAMGAVLATIDPEPFELRVQSAEADLKKAEADYRNRASDYGRKLELNKEGVASASDLDLALANREGTKSTVTMARSALDIARRDLRSTILRAPYDGSISHRSIEPYVDVASGHEVFHIDAEGGLEVELKVPENVINRLSVGSSGRVTFSTLPGVEVEGVLSELGSRAV